MSKIYEIADGFVDTLAELNPIVATHIGVPGYDHLMPNFSPEASDRNNEAERDALRRIQAEHSESLRERRCQETVQEEMTWSIDQYQAGLHYSGMNILHSPVQSLRQIFDLMPRKSTQDWENIASRMKEIEDSLASYRVTLEEGIDIGLTTSKRQTSGCIEQIDTWIGNGGVYPFFDGIADAGAESDDVSEDLAKRLADAARGANAAYSEFAEYLRKEYMPKAREQDAVGFEHYSMTSRSYNGIDLDLDEMYEWGWDQLRWVQSEMVKAADQIKPGASIDEAVEILESDSDRAIDGVDEFREWMQNLQDSTITDMDGTHFDIADPVREIEAMIAPPGGALAMYYTGPSEDFSRPGRTWYPTGGKKSFPLWREVSIAYHEGVPGHHFQIATTMTLSEQLSRYQRLLAGTSGYVEGWALYAERLMHELGYLENPDYYMGMLDAQALRSVRVIIDIGMHLEKRIPDDSKYHPGEVWTPDLALEFMRDRVHFPADFVASEIDRYLGIPGQAISYKVGERVWLEARRHSREGQGASFDLKEWHNQALELGPMGLAQMQREMSRI